MKKKKGDEDKEKIGSYLEEGEDENERMSEDIEENSFESEDSSDVESEALSNKGSNFDEEYNSFNEESDHDIQDGHDGGRKNENYSKSDNNENGKNDADSAFSLQKGGKYVPPQLRKFTGNANGEEDKKLERLKKQLKGLVNR